MKTYTCDVCGKDFGSQVSSFMCPSFRPDNFTIDSGFYTVLSGEKDICSPCFNRIAKAQNDEIEKIKKSK